MKKIFSINKFFISFCVFFILVWIALQAVGYMRLNSMARLDSDRILAWSWPNKNIKATIKIDNIKIVSKSHNDAVVKVLADQSIGPIIAQEINTAQSKLDDKNTQEQQKRDLKCALTLTYYRTNSQWLLGKVDFQ